MGQHASNTPAAAARIVALAMMADETLHPNEIGALDAIDPWDELGMTREQFLTLTSECFEEMMCDMHMRNRAMLLDDLALDHSLAAVSDPALQALTYRMVVALLPADGHLSPAELSVLQRMLDRWKLPDQVLEGAVA